MYILIFLINNKTCKILFYCYVKYIERERLDRTLNRNLSAQCYAQKINNVNIILFLRNSQIDGRDRSMKQAILTVCVSAIFLVEREVYLV